MAKPLNSSVSDYFERDDAASQWWHVTFETGGRYGKQLRFLERHTDVEGRNLMDVATGQGRFAISHAKRGARPVRAVDIAEAMLEKARANATAHGVIDKIEFTCANVLDIDLTPGSFYGITLMEVLVHLPDPQAAITGLARLLEPGGFLAINYDYESAERVIYPIDRVNAWVKGLARGQLRPGQIMHSSVEDAVGVLEGEGAAGGDEVNRPEDAYRGIAPTEVHRWVAEAGLEIAATRREYPRALRHVPVPIPIGEMIIARKR